MLRPPATRREVVFLPLNRGFFFAFLLALKGWFYIYTQLEGDKRMKHSLTIFLITMMIVSAGCQSFNAPLNSVPSGTGTWESAFSVAQALDNQDDSTKTVEGVIVGIPISETRIESSNFDNDYAIAIADLSNETETDKMVYVQLPSSYRTQFGLQTNPNLLGKSIKVTGCLSDYYAHAGVKCLSKIELSAQETNEESPIKETETPYDDTYYKEAIGKTDSTLKQALHDIIDDHNELTYDEVWDALRQTDEDPDDTDNVILFYTGRSQDKLLNGDDVDDWNREHVWAKSHGDFGTSMGAGTDLHNLRPTDVTVNSSRGNKDFDDGGAPHPEADGTFADGDSWEPRDDIKGDVARTLFYMAVRYEGDVEGEIDLELIDRVDNGSVPLHGNLSTLLQWNKEDPVDDFERRRNDVIYTEYQGNRNPFIDHPEWADEIW